MRELRIGTILTGLVIAPCALVLGYIGFRGLPGVTMGRSDALFSSLQLFALGAPLPTGGMPWTLDIARFLAPLAIVYATVLAVVAILWDQVQLFRLSLLAQNHIVLVGLGSSNARLAASFRRSGQRVAVVEGDPTNELISGSRAGGVSVVIGDARQSSILRRARVARAQHVIVATGEDSRNLEVAEQVRRLALRDGKGRHTTVHVRVDDQILWMELGRQQLSAVRPGAVLEFFNAIDLAAQQLLNEAERICGEVIYRSVLIEGDDALAQRTVVHLVRRAALRGARPRLHISELASETVLTPLLDRDPWVGASAEIVTRSDPGGSAGQVDVALVCPGESDAEALACGLRLAKRTVGPTVCVAVRGEQDVSLLASVGAPTRVHLISVTAGEANAGFLSQAGLELMARARHEDYLTQGRARGMTEAENPSLVAWEELPESLKDSNRRFAESVGEVIETLGGVLAPLESLELDAPLLESGELLERLARKEHDRWMKALRDDGWRYSPGTKDAERKTHPLLVPWDELPEAEKEKDRDAIRAIPRMLARVGWGIELP